ncbi:hypothetical protein CCACVL1_18117 [Corchorus capsularis]|uniref:Uncharacterized protein n=1 Tax=Corchorus capsularis TaxID=210143 RepID=A0A1R3HMV0_COCAP|nr:hypothetical protein CCACVL1_18117 [Corchorus capsularis]
MACKFCNKTMVPGKLLVVMIMKKLMKKHFLFVILS